MEERKKEVIKNVVKVSLAILGVVALIGIYVKLDCQLGGEFIDPVNGRKAVYIPGGVVPGYAYYIEEDVVEE